MKCMSYRKNYILSDRKVKELQAQLLERDRMDQTNVEEMQTLLEKIRGLRKSDFALENQDKEVTLSEGRKEGFEAGREVGLVEGQKKGFEEGQAGRISLEEHHQISAHSRIPVLRDFLKTDTFKIAVEVKSTDSFANGYKTCESQIEKLGGFQESFDRSKMDITLDGDVQPYPNEPDLEDDEFAALREEIEAED
ncbi:UNVERIFIED_CONTAM: hypothetical protein Sindi_2024800 [Sesamum indicum]